MRVLHVIIALDSVGGAERMLQKLALEQRSRLGIEPILVALGTAGSLGDALRASGIPVHALGFRGMANLLPTLWRLRALIRKVRPDIVQTWMYHADLLGGLAARLAGRRNIVWNVRNTELFLGRGVSRSLGIVMRLCAWLSSVLPRAIICVARSARVSHERFGYAPAKMLVIPNGFVEPRETDAGIRRAARLALGIPQNALVVGSVGRFNAYKDQRNFVRAMAEVVSEVPEAIFLMVGREVGWSNVELHGWIDATDHADRFVLLGERGDVAQCFEAMDIFCLHSKSEGFPNVLAEAMLAGIPCVATDVGDAGLLGDGLVTIVPPGDSAALASAVTELCALSSDARMRRGRSGRRHVAASYSLRAVAELYRNLYRDLVARDDSTGIRL